MNEKQALLELSKEELVEIILELQKQIQELRDQNKRPPKTPHNSSKPPSQERKGNRGKKHGTAKRGPKEGHVGKSRERAEPDVVVRLPVGQCARCGMDLSQVEQKEIGSSQIVELPPMRPVVIEARRCEVCCPGCGHEQQSAYPPGLEAERVFGPRLEAVVHYLHMVHPLGYGRVQSLLRDLTGQEISIGALVNMVKRGRETFGAAAQSILETIRESEIIGSDETGARIDGDNAWLWVVQTPTSAYYTIAPTRGAVVLEDLMAGHKPLVWISDLAKAQLKQPAVYRQICIPHQVRDLQYAIDDARCAWAYRFQALLLRAQRLGRQRDDMPPHEYGRQVVAVGEACDALLAQIPKSDWSQNLRRRFLKHRHHLFTFLFIPNVPSSNNASEQALRNSVIYRKVTGGFRSDWGAEAYANIISIIETARRRGQNILHTLLDLLATPFDLTLTFSPTR